MSKKHILTGTMADLPVLPEWEPFPDDGKTCQICGGTSGHILPCLAYVHELLADRMRPEARRYDALTGYDAAADDLYRAAAQYAREKQWGVAATFWQLARILPQERGCYFREALLMGEQP